MSTSATIPLSNGRANTLVDAEDVARLSEHRWYLRTRPNGRGFYAATKATKANGRSTTLYLHRAVMCSTDPDIDVDHINGDGLDNRKCNLRETTRSANNCNSIIIKNKLGTRGISKTRHGHFRAVVWIKRKRIECGTYKTLDLAKAARSGAIRAVYGAAALRQLTDEESK